MRLLLIGVAMMLPASGASAPAPAGDMPVIKPGPSQADANNCPPISRFHAAKGADRTLFQRLGDLPSADAYKAVQRHVGRCEAPIIVRYGIGEEQSR